MRRCFLGFTYPTSHSTALNGTALVRPKHLHVANKFDRNACQITCCKVVRHFTWLLFWNRLLDFAGSCYLGVSHSVNAEDSPKCIRTLFIKSCGEDVRGGFFRCSTRDSDQSFRCLSTVFHCSSWILNDKIASLHQTPWRLRLEALEKMHPSRKTTRDTLQWCSYTTAWRILGKLKCQEEWKVGKIYNFLTREQKKTRLKSTVDSCGCAQNAGPLKRTSYSKVERNRRNSIV